MDSEFFAHSASGPVSNWEPLDFHLRAVADRARQNAEAFGAGDWGFLAGLWHDLGKYLPEFQRRLSGDSARVDHAGPGAAAVMTHGSIALPLAFAIAGHHSGLPNLQTQSETHLTPLLDRANKQRPAWDRFEKSIPAEFWPLVLPQFPFSDASPTDDTRRSLELWIRFLFSALVDADYLETERFYDPSIGERRGKYDSLDVLRQRLDEHLARFKSDTTVNRARAQILADCRRAAEQSPGIFSLTVPTGGGKTLSGLAFALDHAHRHGLRRVVVAIPYTSIIEQTADTYRDILGDQNVLEHHSNLDVQRRWEQDEEMEGRRRLAAENWDAPVVVTTNVQLFESLLANQPSKCRKLHNLARAVIILDEAQCLPIDKTMTVIDLLNDLSARYGSTIVLSTATQPALKERLRFPGLRNVHEIIADPPALAARLRRVSIHWPEPAGPRSAYAEIASKLAAHSCVLAIVHRRVDARDLAKLVPPEGRFHLSALMCPAHRRYALERIRRRLLDRQRGGQAPLRVIATQLVEAGVDVDFPVVYRALAGLDSVAQAAGRCDREGRATEAAGHPAGEVFIFRAPTDPPHGVLRQGVETTESMLNEFGETLDLSQPDIFERYFRQLYSKHPLDRGLQGERAALNFATVANKSSLIEDGYMTPIVVPYGDSAERLERFRANPDRMSQRGLQPYLVQITPKQFSDLESIGGVDRVDQERGVNVLSPICAHLYDREFGLVIDESSSGDPKAYVV